MSQVLCGCAPPGRRADGFTLLEVLVATAVVVGGLASAAQLVVLTARSTVASRDTSYAGTLALQKLSELATDDLARVMPSPPDAWMHTADGHVEYLDAAGTTLASNGQPPGATLYIRRWSVTPLAGDSTGGVVLVVSVGRLHRQILDGMPAAAAPSAVARVVGIRTGRVP